MKVVRFNPQLFPIHVQKKVKRCGTPDPDEPGTYHVDVESDCWKNGKRERQKGPGDLVKAVLTKLGFKEIDGMMYCANGKRLDNCGCEAMRYVMNDWDWSGCLLNANTILSWFWKKGKDCGVELDEALIYNTLTALIQEMRTDKV